MHQINSSPTANIHTHRIDLLHVIVISCVAAIGGFLFGFDTGVINGTVDALRAAFHSSSVGAGFNVASMLLGCAAGALFAGASADKFGRRMTMIGTAIFFAISAWGSGIATNSPEFVFYRVLGGIAVGAASVICPAYISEVSPAALRGRLAALQQLAIVLGLFAAFLSNYLIGAAAKGASSPFWFGFQAWQWMFWMELIPAIIFLFALFFIPESPRYLVTARKLDRALLVFEKLGFLAQEAERKIQEVMDTLEKDHRPRLRDLFDKVTGKIYPIVWTGIGLGTFSQLVGINVVFYYGAVLWQAAGFSEGDALLINVISGIVNITATVAAMALVDKIGRKPLLIFGSIGMAATLGTLAYIFATSGAAANGNLKLTPQAGTIALIAANTYVFLFCISWGPVVWVMLGEMFKNQIRGAAISVSGCSVWTANFVITVTFPLLLEKCGLGGAYGLYTFCALLSLFFVISFVRETKGKTLEEM